MRNVPMVLVGMPEDSKPLGNKDVNGGKYYSKC
jgi:hypothetical protein